MRANAQASGARGDAPPPCAAGAPPSYAACSYVQLVAHWDRATDATEATEPGRSAADSGGGGGGGGPTSGASGVDGGRDGAGGATDDAAISPHAAAESAADLLARLRDAPSTIKKDIPRTCVAVAVVIQPPTLRP